MLIVSEVAGGASRVAGIHLTGRAPLLQHGVQDAR